jgi:hypothetical protein
MITACEPEEIDPDDPGEEKVPVAYQVYEMTIQVENNAPIVSKENEDYLACSIRVEATGELHEFQATGRIRGRGNSSWFWYEKKPYRIKLDQKYPLLGLGTNSDFVLLANYRDPTDLMNVFGFEAADWLSLPYTNHTRFVELTLNGEYIGLYQLTEQVEQGANRVDVDESEGWLICLDVDDGPDSSPFAGDNFWSVVFSMPVCVKYPELLTVDELYQIRNDLAKLEQAIKDYDYDSVSARMDIPSLINYLIVQELVYNVEIDAPRSVFMHKDIGGKYVMGPVWDFDAGFDFDWGSMYTGHDYFDEQELVMGTDPANHKNGYRIPDFFTQMFRNQQFIDEYKSRWNEVKDSIVEHAWSVMEEYEYHLQDALARDFARWPIDRNYSTETPRMEEWLSDRVTHLTSIINNYPAGTVSTVKIDCGTISCDVTLSYETGYHQDATITVDESSLLSKLGITTGQLYSDGMKIVPLKTDGSEGMNNTNGVFGGWFEADNNPGYWSKGHVYIEIMDNRTVWNCGLRAEDGYCAVGDKHTVRMQYQFTQETVTKTLTVVVTFTIAA